MRSLAALKRAWAVYRQRPGEVAAMTAVELALRGMVLAPLLFLADGGQSPQELLRTLSTDPAAFFTAGGWQSLASLSALLFVLIVPPARYSAAEAYQRALRGGALTDTRLVFDRGYGQRVWRGIKQGLIFLAWFAPLTAVTVWALRLYYASGEMGVNDGLTVVGRVYSLGLRLGGDTVTGAKWLAIAYIGLLAVTLLIALPFHCGRRHEKALSNRRFLRGHCAGVMGTWYGGLLFTLPFVAAAFWLLSDYVSALAQSFSDGLTGFTLPEMGGRVALLALAFVLLEAPLRPLRGLWTAAYVRACWEERG